MARFTKQAIMNEFTALILDRPLEKITVTDLVKIAGINRNTFYYYFHDIYALAAAVVEQGMEEALAPAEPSADFGSLLSHLLGYAEQNRRLIGQIYHADHRIVEQALWRCLCPRILARIKSKAKDLPTDAADLVPLAEVCTHAATGGFLCWMNSGMRESASARLLNNTELLDDSIRAILLHRAAQPGSAQAG